MSDQITQTIAAGASLRVERFANFFLLAETDAPVSVALYRNGTEFLSVEKTKAGDKFRSNDGMTAAKITNPNASPVEVVFFMAQGDTDVQVGDANSRRGALTTTAHEVTNADAELVAADAKLKTVEIQNNHATAAIYLATGSGPVTTTNGVKVGAGDCYTYPIAPTNGVRAIGDVASNTQIIVVKG